MFQIVWPRRCCGWLACCCFVFIFAHYECSIQFDQCPCQTSNCHLRRRMLLVRRGRFPTHSRRQIGHVRFRRRDDSQSQLRRVCTGTTGHAEVIQIQFDPSVISYDKLLEIFWESHDPTTLNRQGNDAGTQYRSIILYSDEAQKAAAEKSKAESAKNFSSPIVTQIVPLTKFYPAEQYHQNYYNQHTHQSYCQCHRA